MNDLVPVPGTPLHVAPTTSDSVTAPPAPFVPPVMTKGDDFRRTQPFEGGAASKMATAHKLDTPLSAGIVPPDPPKMVAAPKLPTR